MPMVDEALASAAFTNTSGAARTPSRKTRWTTEQIEALIEGVEKYGLSAWRTIVMVGWQSAVLAEGGVPCARCRMQLHRGMHMRRCGMRGHALPHAAAPWHARSPLRHARLCCTCVHS